MTLHDLFVVGFGGLSQFEQSFEAGFSIVLGENEAGKSTLMAFLRAMFYGFPRTSRDPNKDERKRFRPWQGGKMGGHVTFSIGGMQYRLERTFGERKRDDTTILSLVHTGGRIELLNPHEPGVELFTLSENDFITRFLFSKMLLLFRIKDRFSHVCIILPGQGMRIFPTAMSRNACKKPVVS